MVPSFAWLISLILKLLFISCLLLHTRFMQEMSGGFNIFHIQLHLVKIPHILCMFFFFNFQHVYVLINLLLFLRVHVLQFQNDSAHDFYKSLVRVPKPARLCRNDESSCDCGKVHTILFPIHRILALCTHTTAAGNTISSMKIKHKLQNHLYDLYNLVKVKSADKIWETYKQHWSDKFDGWYIQPSNDIQETS